LSDGCSVLGSSQFSILPHLPHKILLDPKIIIYRAFHRFGQAKFPDGGLVLGSSQFSIMTQLPPKMMLSLKEVKIDLKISNLLC